MLSFLPILPLLLLLCFLFGTNAATELDILLDLKSSLRIQTSTLGFQSWTPSSSSSSPCTFSGISCNSHGSVQTIDLNNRGLSGTIPFASLCYLPNLINISLSNNHLTGTISPAIKNCNRLQFLDLSFNTLSGQIPDLSSLTSLTALKLNQNLFTGVFPWSSLANLTGLVYLSLGDNPLFDESPFPETLVNLPNLSVLYLSVCNLRGNIPASVGKLTELVDLELSDNFLHGEIPNEITKLTKLWQLQLYNNSLTGKLPQGFGNLSELVLFDASMNNLEADLSELRFLSKLMSLQLFFNDFSS